MTKFSSLLLLGAVASLFTPFTYAADAPAATPTKAPEEIAPAPGPDSGMLPVTDGPFKPDWDSLHQYKTPDWFRDAKFGIWAHWTAQCVPERGDWYARRMYGEYNNGKINDSWKWHLEHYGPQSVFGFKDIDHIWTAAKWDPDKLIALYKKAGAKYFVALANHHDNFDCFDSKYQPWNSVNIGPKRDIVGDWAKAARAAGLRFGVTVHAARSWVWLDVSHGADVDGKYAGVPYDGNLTAADGKGKWWDGYDPAELYGPAGAARTPEAHLKYNVKFYNRTLDLVHKYKPDLLYFDDSVLPLSNQPGDYGLKIAADFYNSSILWHGKNEAIMNTKGLDVDKRKCLLRDIERGKNETIDPSPWQTDTCIGGWHYDARLFEKHLYKKPELVISMLLDIISKNGNLLLNIPVKGDGTIDSDEEGILESMASWMAINSESIYGTRPWEVYGEGPSTATNQGQGKNQKDVSNTPYKPEDFRFVVKGNVLYVSALGGLGKSALINSLATGTTKAKVQDVSLLGDKEKLDFTQDASGLSIKGIPEKLATPYIPVFKVTLVN